MGYSGPISKNFPQAEKSFANAKLSHKIVFWISFHLGVEQTSASKR